MRIVHTHDPFDRVPVTPDQIKLAIKAAHDSMWDYAALGEFALAHIRELAVDRMLLALAQLLPRDEV